MSPLHPQIGQRVGDRYVLTAPVASGGMGEVWKAQDEVLGREVAVKLLRREYAADGAFLDRFRNEARHAASLGHPGIAQVYDYGEDEGTAYLVMELVPGEPLSARLLREGALPASVAVPLLQQTAEALHAAHLTGLVHRDVKPGNLLITPEGRVKITDFGIARAGDQAPLTRTGEVMGTAQYLSPEQAMGRTATPASDVYALGIVAYEMLTGHRPFEADTAVAIALAQVNNPPPDLPPSVPAPVAAAVMLALAKDPADRPGSAAEFADTLGAALAGVAPLTAPTSRLRPSGQAAMLPPVGLPIEPVTPAVPLSATTVPDQPPRKGRAGLVAAVLAIMLIAAAVAYGISRSDGDPTAPGTPTTPSTSDVPTTDTTSSSSTTSEPTTRTSTTSEPTSPTSTTTSSTTTSTTSTSSTTSSTTSDTSTTSTTSTTSDTSSSSSTAATTPESSGSPTTDLAGDQAADREPGGGP